MTSELGSDFQTMSAPEGALRYKRLNSFGAVSAQQKTQLSRPLIQNWYFHQAPLSSSRQSKELALKVSSIQAFSENYALQLLSLLLLLFLFSVMSFLI